MEQFCKDCKYFARYYTRTGTRFNEVDIGFCTEKRPNSKGSERFTESGACDKFTPAPDETEKTEKNIRYCLTSIRRQLEYLTWVLESRK